MITVEGKNGIKATVLAHSISPDGIVFLTYELEYPRLVLSELNTHRMLSKNSFSSRAVPFAKMLEQLTGEPVRFGQSNPGMQDKGVDYDAPVMLDEQLEYDVPYAPQKAWAKAKALAVAIATAFYKAGFHKQVYNRLLEPWQMMKTVISATEWENFFWLRDDDAADPTLREMARVMKEAKEQSTPVVLKAGQWHLPYIAIDWDLDEQCYYMDNSYSERLTLEDAIKVSCARCAAVSYRNEGYGLEKSRELFDRLVGSEKKHASALEHCASPVQGEHNGRHWTEDINVPFKPQSWEPGITHVDRKGQLWSGNLRGWIQYRKLVPGESYVGE